MAQTTNRHLLLRSSSGYLASFRRRAASSRTPSSPAARGYGVLSLRTGLTSVASTPNCAPPHSGKLSASTSSRRSSSTFSSKSKSLRSWFSSTRAPASRSTLAQVLSSGFALCPSLPTLGQAALWSPSASTAPPHLQRFVSRGSFKRSRRKSTMRRCCGCTVLAGSTGSAVRWAPEPLPDCDLSTAFSAEARAVSIALSLCCLSSWEAAKYCQPCLHSPGSVSVACSGLFPSHSSCQLGHCVYPAARTIRTATSASPLLVLLLQVVVENPQPVQGSSSSSWAGCRPMMPSRQLVRCVVLSASQVPQVSKVVVPRWLPCCPVLLARTNPWRPVSSTAFVTPPCRAWLRTVPLAVGVGFSGGSLPLAPRTVEAGPTRTAGPVAGARVPGV